MGRTETERKSYQYRVTLRFLRTQQNPYGLAVSSVEQSEIPMASFSRNPAAGKKRFPTPSFLAAITEAPMRRGRRRSWKSCSESRHPG